MSEFGKRTDVIKNTWRLLATGLTVVFLSSACAPQPAAVPTNAPPTPTDIAPLDVTRGIQYAIDPKIPCEKVPPGADVYFNFGLWRVPEGGPPEPLIAEGLPADISVDGATTHVFNSPPRPVPPDQSDSQLLERTMQVVCNDTTGHSIRYSVDYERATCEDSANANKQFIATVVVDYYVSPEAKDLTYIPLGDNVDTFLNERPIFNSGTIYSRVGSTTTFTTAPHLSGSVITFPGTQFVNAEKHGKQIVITCR